jgi:dihydropyrimidinase
MLDLKIVNGQVVIPEIGEVSTGIGIQSGRVVSLADPQYLPDAERTVDAGGRVVIPGVIDPHIHLGNRSPYADECVTETRSALLGGVTTLGVFLRRQDSYLPHLGDLIATAEERISADLFFHLQIFNTAQIDEIPECAERFGITSFKMYMNNVPGVFPYVEDGLLLRAFRKVAELGPEAIACVHAEVASIIHEAHHDIEARVIDGTLADWCDTHPPEAEELAILRAAYLAELAKVRLYIVHLTSRLGVERLRNLRSAAGRISVETTTPALSLTKYDPSGLVSKRHPPLRDVEDREALWEGVTDGTIDTLGTDNITTTLAASRLEEGWLRAKGGFPMLATHLPVMLSEGYHARGVPLITLVQKACLNPAKIFSLYPRKGTIAPGSDADIVILDIDREETVDVRKLQSFGDVSPYHGRRLRGWPWKVIKGGVVAVEDGTLTVEPGSARYLRRSLASTPVP